jgi:hypothetical protein
MADDHGRRVSRLRQYIRHPRFLWWALTNRLKGYKFGAVQRCQHCDHTTPCHYATCDLADGDTDG